jgi:hypothetical protein
MHQVAIPKISERIRGFTPPKNGVFHVFDYDEVFRVELEGSPKVEVLDKNPYDFEAECGEYYGVSEKSAVLSQAGYRVTYNFDPAANEIAVSVAGPNGKEVIDFPTLSGDWFVATIEENGKYLFIAEPYQLNVYLFSTHANT